LPDPGLLLPVYIRVVDQFDVPPRDIRQREIELERPIPFCFSAAINRIPFFSSSFCTSVISLALKAM
jgi:hypothetical protein